MEQQQYQSTNGPWQAGSLPDTAPERPQNGLEWVGMDKEARSEPRVTDLAVLTVISTEVRRLPSTVCARAAEGPVTDCGRLSCARIESYGAPSYLKRIPG
jgi:hypothetical protein